MMPPAGTMIPEKVVPTGMCGTHAPGWMNGVHPRTLGEEVERQICFNHGGNDCRWSKNIKITNCGKYYVYKLVSTVYCRLRYCAVDGGMVPGRIESMNIC